MEQRNNSKEVWDGEKTRTGCQKEGNSGAEAEGRSTSGQTGEDRLCCGHRAGRAGNSGRENRGGTSLRRPLNNTFTTQGRPFGGRCPCPAALTHLAALSPATTLSNITQRLQIELHITHYVDFLGALDMVCIVYSFCPYMFLILL